MSMLPELLDYAQEQERQKTLLPIWLLDTAVKTLNNEKPISFEKMLGDVRTDTRADKEQMTPDEIMKIYAPIVEADRKRSDA